MRNRYTILAAATALAMGSYTFAQETPGEKADNAADRAGNQIDRAADRTGDAIRRGVDGTVAAPDAEGIRDVLAQVAEASVTKDGLDDLVERFVDADRNRLGQSSLDNNEKLNGIIDQFRKNWKAKYNQDFDIADEDAVFNESFARIMQGEIGADGARMAGERQPGVTPGASPDAAPDRVGGATDPNVPADRDKIAGGDTNKDPGRNVATVLIQESHGMPSLVVPLIHEMPDSWRLDVPDTLTAEQLRGNVENCLTKLNEGQAQWPADVNDAYRAVTHGVLLAVIGEKEGHGALDKGMDKAMPGTDRQPATPGQPAPR